ncbi:flagellar hook-associated protein 1 FlgK [Devosia sp. YR412]|uniref:flagellar hook-associated protein FlgK n=1 Tax=Devosia sp. YR412 TaxID=1881030 RepID=UPI0008C2E929|nr:flagellar hook-associated protein FlgK [Devosia sp. YR412]SEQ52255.1 flagellar hook-associated protein 1 FlgK [Devosia sp. YR412]
MSFAAIRSTAYSALSASQVRTQIAANNIANADTAGYSTKSASQSALLSGTLGTGVAITAITSAVSKFLLSDLVSATSTAGASDIAQSFAQSIADLMGSTSSSTGNGTSLAQSLADLETAASALVSDPNSDTAKAQLVSALDTVASQLRSTGSAVQTLRGQADQAIADGVETVNQALETIAGLNSEIVAAKATGQSTADLEDKRNQALQVVAGQLDVDYSITANGAMRLTTGSGTALVDSTVHLLSYAPAALATADTVFSAITVGGAATNISGGAIGGLLVARDKTLPSIQSELDTLAAGLIASINAGYGATLLTGTGANSIAVAADILATPTALVVTDSIAASALESAITSKWTFSQAGSISSGARSFADYAATIVGNAATVSSVASARNEVAQASLSTAQSAISSSTGVNLDEETAKLSELEQYYSVAAQILSTLNAMFDSLLQAAQSA